MDVTGTIVGFRAPSYAQGMTVAGYHLHFISSEHTQGGHVLDFTLAEGRVLVDQDTDIHLEMPTSPLFLGTPVSGDHVADQIEAAENASRQS